MLMLSLCAEHRADIGVLAGDGDEPMGVPTVADIAHETVLIPADRWERWHEIARAIGNDDCDLIKELRKANTIPTRRNLYWAVTAARILVQWTTGDRQRLANAVAVELEYVAALPHRAPVRSFAGNGDVPVGVRKFVDVAHETVSIPAETWQRWHEIARAIGNDDCGLTKELYKANDIPTRRNLYWAVTAARILVQWTTGDRQKLANAIAVELEHAAVPPD